MEREKLVNEILECRGLLYNSNTVMHNITSLTYHRDLSEEALKLQYKLEKYLYKEGADSAEFDDLK